MSDERDREERAARRRATWTGEVVSLGTPKPALHDDATPEERVARLQALVIAQWELAHGAVVRLPRAEWPGEVFRIERKP
jgi:hypothetical protein